ncbi:DoxX family protein [Bordetella avium]|uniref:DoxX family protein n=1 Tax=Bordetella avium TaxID=521 RepID=UPI0039FD767C
MKDSISFKLDIRTAGQLVIALMRLYLGAWMVVSGASYWLHQLGYQPIFPQPFGTLPASNKMLITLVEVGLFNLVKTLEIVGGLFLIGNIFVPLGLLILFPISGMVFYNAVFLNQRYEGIFSLTYMGTLCLYMNVVLLLAYIKHYLPMLALNARSGSLSDIKRLPEIFR